MEAKEQSKAEVPRSVRDGELTGPEASTRYRFRNQITGENWRGLQLQPRVTGPVGVGSVNPISEI